MQKIKIAFDGFWKGFDSQNNFITNALRTNFDVEICSIGDFTVDAIFYSIYAKEYLKYDCPRIYYTGENAVPDFNLCDYAIGFEPLQIGDRYINYSVAQADFHKDCVLMERKNETLINAPFDRKFCAMVVSNSINTEPTRDDFFYQLSKYKTVDSGGRHLNNIGLPDGVPDKIEFLQNYKFSLAFENVSHVGYCTEKLPQSFAAGTVPIYWGDPNVSEYYNPKAFINLHDYPSFQDAIDDIIKIDNDEKLYLEMLNEKAVINPYYSLSEIDRRFEEWICSIFRQAPEKRFRCNRAGYAKLYLDKQQKLLNILDEEEKRLKRKNGRKNSFFYFSIRRIIKYAKTHTILELFNKLKSKLFRGN